MIHDWHSAAGDGLIACSLGRKCEMGESLSAIGLLGIVRKHGAMIGVNELDPDILRRTYAQLGYDAGVPITQISKLFGHSSIATIQRYLNLDLNLDLDLDIELTVSDFIPLE
jgi:integrase